MSSKEVNNAIGAVVVIVAAMTLCYFVDGELSMFKTFVIWYLVGIFNFLSSGKGKK